MSSPSTTTILAKVVPNEVLLSTVACLYADALVEVRDDHPNTHAQGWREQLAALMAWYGRATVMELLVVAVPGLSIRQATALANLAEREGSAVRQAVAAG